MLSKLSKLSEEYNVDRLSILKLSANGAPLDRYSHDKSGPMYDICNFLSEVLLTRYSADPGATMTFVAGGALKPIGGHILSHASATRMFLRKGAIYVSGFMGSCKLCSFVDLVLGRVY